MFGISNLLTRQPKAGEPHDGLFVQPHELYCAPGHWVSLTAKARSLGLGPEDIGIKSRKLIRYAQAIAIETALNRQDRYPFGRPGKGKGYSPLVVLAQPEDVDQATSDISSCLRTIFPSLDLREFVRDVSNIVGELHDNVWSHGESTGISMASRWAKPYTAGAESCFEFALADCGRGLRNELLRAGVNNLTPIPDDKSAIEWCIQEGNSSKTISEPDPWAQRLPEDAMGNPIGDFARVLPRGSHHQGLGLFKLVQLVQRYAGSLWLASGRTMLHIDGAKATQYIPIAVPWSGVAMACRFSTDSVQIGLHRNEPDEMELLIRSLLGAEPNVD